MKKTLLASILISCGTGAIAQSSVTLFGIVDATLQYSKSGRRERDQAEWETAGSRAAALAFAALRILAAASRPVSTSRRE